ncbi:hypothetical protein Bbelb_329000 [Branchiostoma belcheri]|nr:hypothetical protein Bbelb_329000 [Branchiostoma belcheri]
MLQFEKVQERTCPNERGAEETWPTWACLNRLRTGTGRCRTLMKKRGLAPDGQTACDCGQEQAMRHLLVCPLLPEPCIKKDLEALTPVEGHARSFGGEGYSSGDQRRRRVKETGGTG